MSQPKSKSQPRSQSRTLSEPAETLRPTKKQQILLEFIKEFIEQHGYSPSYREIMTGLKYTSVATVALHINSLIKRGHLHKRDRSARSLELVEAENIGKLNTNEIRPGDEKWLVEKIDHFFKKLENGSSFQERELDELYVLIGALKVLGLDGAAQSFIPRLTAIKDRKSSKKNS